MKQYLQLMRVKHYIKNGLILLPLAFSGRLSDAQLALRALYGIVAFSLISSVVYIVNDIVDAPYDRAHPTKCGRPIACGAISPARARRFAAVLAGLALAAGWFACGPDWRPWAILGLYLGLNLAYSLKLKNIPILDIAILASGFLLRVLFGSAITGIDISRWLYLTVMAMSFFMGLGKRRNELVRQSDSESRRVLRYYNFNFLNRTMYMCLTLTIVFYSLWSVDSGTVARLGDGRLVWTVPLVILICMKYSLTVEGNSDGDPVEVILRDKPLLGMIGVFGAVMMGIVYF